ncbi:MAG TPA: septal ring lytic transglycosylase RlpA family protein [Castellaniella sp.]|uniref:septal ring lytic transglycosylase RlpA family protein n=1 Tax=Castellaniella sp. TaxID=1955812 RepID=UPI002EF5C912
MNLLPRRLTLILFCVIVSILAGCATRSRYSGNLTPAQLAAIPDAVPKVERPAPANFRPYEVYGVRYYPIPENQPYRRQGIASWYGPGFHGEKTANGEKYDMYSMTAAQPVLPVPSYARVTRVSTGKSIIVRINDRGPFHPGRIIDLSYVAAAKLGLIGPGSGEVVVQAITNNDILAGNYPRDSAPMLASAAPESAVTSPVPAMSTPVAYVPPPPPAAPRPMIPPVSPTGRGTVYLQFGAFASSENAQAFSERINSRINAQTAVTRQANLYKVRMGPYSTRDEALRAAAVMSRTADVRPVIATD